tara:strand:+ start:236 stop:601 length:366 start_codon:yes stop_codon:yes gene_type:complete
MKKIFSAFVLSLVMITSANAEHEKNTYNSQKPVSCNTVENVTNLLAGTFKEMPYMQGDGLAPALDGGQFIKTNIIISLNLETQTFSVVEIINGNLACIIAGGNNFRFNKPVGNKTNISLER